MSAAVRARKGEEAAAQAMDEARAAIRRATEGADDDAAPPNGLDDVLNLVYEGAGCEHEESKEEVW